MLAERHVRRLKVRSQESVAIPRITTLLEDAIRTASLPNIPANGVVCIRRLDLGRISTSTHSHFLSRRLDQLIRNLPFTHITTEQPEQDDAVAVWFADAIEPYRLLSELKVKGQTPRAWYWSIAVPHWLPSMSTSDSVLLCLSQLVQKPTGMTGITYALEPLVERASMFAVLDSIDTRQLKAIVNDLPLPSAPFINPELVKQAIPETDIATGTVANYRLPKEWRLFLRQSLQCWKPNDIRLRLALGMTLQKAGMTPNTRNVMNLVQGVLQQDIPDARNKSNSASTPTQPNVDDPTVTDSKDLSSQVQLLREEFSQESSSQELSSEQLYSQESPATRVADGSSMDDLEVIGDGGERITTQRKDALQIKKDGLQEPPPAQETEPRQKDRWLPKPEQQPLFGHYSGELSAYGGFLFLLPVLQRLGISTQSETYVDDERLHLPQRVLWRIANWLRIPADDPVLQFLDQPLNDPPISLPFVAPRQWQVLLKNGSDSTLQVARIPSQPGKRFIKDPASRLILGVWQHDNKEEMLYWLDRYVIQLQSDSSQAWTIDVLVDNVVIAMCRYVRHYAQMSIRTLVKRPAYIACTATHVDWSASLSALDNRVRMAGLDIDPGWLPALQRVFYFHYIDEEA